MYSNDRKNGFSILDLLVKIIFAGLFIFILVWLFQKKVPNMKPFYSNVFRENIILTLIGAVLGLVLGVYLNFFVISTAEVDMVMFGRQTGILCYVFAFLMTIVFATIINLMMNKELRKIDMIESLKSVE